MSETEIVNQLQTKHANLIPGVSDGSITIVSLARLEGDLALIAVKSLFPDIDTLERCSNAASQSPQLAKVVGVKKLVFVKWDAVPERFIANAFAPVKIRDVRIERDAITGQLGAKVIVDTSEFDAIFDLDAGQRLRLVSVLTQYDIELLVNT